MRQEQLTYWSPTRASGLRPRIAWTYRRLPARMAMRWSSLFVELGLRKVLRSLNFVVRHNLKSRQFLKEAGFLEVRARELARIGGNMISALRRNLRGLGNVPPYATWENASLIAQAGLAGKWDGTSPADRAALEQLLGKDYGEWIENLRPDTLRSDSPLIQRDEKWRFLARGEAWDALGNRITDADLERFEETAVQVLGERDPRFDLPKEERHAAAIHDKVLQHSRQLRSGLAETLALLGSRPGPLSSCTHGKADTTAMLVVRRLLHEARWDRWASLGFSSSAFGRSCPR